MGDPALDAGAPVARARADDTELRERRTRRARPGTPVPKRNPSHSANLNRVAIQDHIATITTALRSLPKDHPSVTAHLLTRSTLYLTLHHASKPAPAQSSSFAQGALRDARQLVHTVPHLPSAWLTLFSACLAVGRPSDADLALRAAARFCPFDPALRYVTCAFRASNTSIAPQPARTSASQSAASSRYSEPVPNSGHILSPKHTTMSSHSHVPARTTVPVRAPSPILMEDFAPLNHSQPCHDPQRQEDRNHQSICSAVHDHAYEWVVQVLRDAEDALLLDAHDDAIENYDKVLAPRPHAPPLSDGMMLRALSGRSDAWLRKALRTTDSATAFSSALTDARQLISLFPDKEDGWIHMSRVYVSYNSPGRARQILKRALVHCPNSAKLADALADVRVTPEHVGSREDWDNFSTPPASPSDASPSDNMDRADVFHKHNPNDAQLDNVSNEDNTFDVQQKQRLRTSGSYHRPPTPSAVLCASDDKLESSSDMTDAQRKEAQWKQAVIRERRRKEAVLRQQQETAKRREAERIAALCKEESRFTSEHELNSKTPNPLTNSAHLSHDSEIHPDSSPSSSPVAPHSDSDESSDHQSRPSTSEDNGPRVQSSSKSFERSEHSRTSLSLSPNPQKLYDLLQVPRDATEAQIKKSYYLLARKYHPDKNADDSQATEQFQRLAEAYRVLSDPESRAIYDRYGDRGLVKNSVDVIDPSTLFAMVFGSDQFVHLIGELQLASLASNVDERGNTPTEDVLADVQRARIGKLVLEMVKALKPWVDGDKKGFLLDAHRQMKNLREASFGSSILHTVGNLYVQQTTYLLDKARPFNLTAVMRKATIRSHKMAAQHKAMTAATRVMDKQRKLHDRVMRTGRDNRYISEEEAKAIAVEMAENAIDMMWKISVIDIETTLEDVLMIVLSGRDLVAEGESFTSADTSFESLTVPEKGRNRRRLGSHLGKEWRDRGDHSDKGDRSDRSDRSDRTRDAAADRSDVGLVRPLAPLSHGEAAATRQEILSERAYGIQAMGRIFMSAAR